ncbi:MAG: SMP-30/gluconolactonase/LRE family protein [Planctomycetota bacterium]|jgi:gluconolactonase
MNSKLAIITVLLFLVTILGCKKQTTSGQISIIASEAKVQKLADGFKFTEGPTADAQGNIYFTDIPNSRIHKWSLDSSVSTFMKDTGRTNGLFFDKGGNLLACVGGKGQASLY